MTKLADVLSVLDRRVERTGVGGEEGGEVASGHVAVRVRAVVGPSGEAGGPVGREQLERVPAFAAPTLGDATTLEHGVFDTDIGEAPAHGQTGWSGADDKGVGGGHLEGSCEMPPLRPGRLPPAGLTADAVQPASTEIATGTPLVSTSNTADRWRDCSTTDMSFSGSSPRIVKLTRICW